MVKQIIWTAEAEKSHEGVIEYLDENWSRKEVRKYIERVMSVVEHISRYPLAYRSAGREEVREALISEHNLLLYRVTGNTIYLLYFWDTRRNPARKPQYK